MTYDYEKLYDTTPDALGNPTQIFVDFFAKQTGKRFKVLDVGCGQGRDALLIARAGHCVVGVDYAPSGIRDMVATSIAENLEVQGIVANIIDFEPLEDFDVVLIDRTLHMLAVEPRLKALKVLASHVVNNGWLLIADEKSNIPAFIEVLEGMDFSWRTEMHKRGNLFLQRL